jgi:hypothetical protein
MMNSLTIAIVLIAIQTLVALAGTRPDGSDVDTVARIDLARLQILTEPDSATVMIRGRIVGKTPLIVDSCAPGVYDLRILHPDGANWLTPVVSDTIRLQGGQTTTVRYSLNGGIIVRSDPDGASVFLRDSLLGETPLSLLRGRWSKNTLLQVKKDGFAPVFVDPSLAVRGVLTVPLQGLPGVAGGGDIMSLVLPSGNGRHLLRLYISSGVALISGVASAYFKITADERQEAYQRSGDPLALSERKRLDTAAGICFAVAQISLALFSYFLLSE